MQRLDIPEGAEVERRLGQAEIVLAGVAQHVLAAAQPLLDRGEGVDEAAVGRVEEAHVEQLQQAGVELVAAEGRGEPLLVLEPGLFLDRLADRGGALAPQFLALGQAQDRKSTRLNSSHSQISYAVFCLKKKKNKDKYNL